MSESEARRLAAQAAHNYPGLLTRGSSNLRASPSTIQALAPSQPVIAKSQNISSGSITGMPYRRSYRKKSRRKSNVSKTLARHSRQLRKLGTPELKYFDVSRTQVEVNFDAPTTAGLLLNGITQGDNSDNRLSDRIRCKSLSGRLSVFSGSDTDAVIRVLIVCFKKGNTCYDVDTTPDLRDVLEAAAAATDVYAFKRADTYFQTKILMDKTMFLPANRITASAIEGGSQGAHRELTFSFPLNKMKGLTHVQFAAAGTDIENNAYMLLATSNVAAAAAGPQIIGNFRLTYWDN